MRALLLLLTLLSLFSACAAPPTRRTKTVYADEPPRSLGEARWVLRRAVCAGADKALVGWTGELRIREREGGYELAFERARGICQATVLYVASRRAPCVDGACPVTLREQARAAVGGEGCLGRPDTPTATTLRMQGRNLRLELRSDELCEGLDAVLDLDAAPPKALDPESLVRHFVAEWNRGSPEGFRSLFAENGVLVEPASSHRGAGLAHEGPRAIEAWFRDYIAARPWVAVRITDLGRTDDTRYTVRWEYLDPELEQPIRGATHLIIGGGAIFRAELWIDRDEAVGTSEPPAP